MNERKVASEDEPGEKWDRCIADAIVKTGVIYTDSWDIQL